MIIVQCCICGKVRHDAQWISIPQKNIESSRISHTYCPECARLFMMQIDSFYNRHSKYKDHRSPKKKL
ncbi:MAG: hypothetical protein N3G21_03570 [Candidatus Hydrogenedentes bacterium]|nr:hypothetical protein [Candidatus Hydrogenedentota bacterium]